MNRRKIFLYIGDQPADLSEESLVQMTYTASDLANPAAVKNSYSQQVTLPATPQNDIIFGHIYRSDRRIVNGDGCTGFSFNPIIRTPFAIYDSQGIILESGYLKLNAIPVKGGVRTYAVTLYGGLGSFLYSLSYDDTGEAMTLAELPLLDAAGTEKVDFTIDAPTVEEAWAALTSNTSGKWQVVNFAPAYNGLPEGDFSADKAIGDPAIFGGETSHEEDGKTYRPYNGFALYDLGEDFTEWETKDLRSYLQRPVVSVQGIIGGIRNWAAAHGFTLELDASWFHDQNPYYRKAWMTLPLLTTLKSEEKTETIDLSGDVISGVPVVGKDGNTISSRLVPFMTTSNATVKVSVRLRPFLGLLDWEDTSKTVRLFYRSTNDMGKTIRYRNTILFAQLVLVDMGGKVVGGSPLQVFLSEIIPGLTTEELAERAGIKYEEQFGVADAVAQEDLSYYDGTVNSYWDPRAKWWTMTNGAMLTAEDVHGVYYAEIRMCGAVANYYVNPPNEKVHELSFYGLEKIYASTMGPGSVEVSDHVRPWGALVDDATLTYTTDGHYRSGSTITQKQLFADSMSPAEFILSYTKTFGLHYLYDKGTKTVRIVTRNTLFDGQTIDLRTRIDHSKDISTNPIPMTAKWLNFAPETVEGEFAEVYKRKYGREYGAQKVNTGFDFDGNTTEVLDSAAFNGAAEVREQSQYFNNVTFGGKDTPSPFLNGKASYRLYLDGSNKDESVELEGLTPDANAIILPFIEGEDGYDLFPKLQFHGDDNSPSDGSRVLVFYNGPAITSAAGAAAYARFRLSDDTSEMYTLAGKPCWYFGAAVPSLMMPRFGRFVMKDDTIIHSMELGIPAEIDIPQVYIDDASVYRRNWSAYISDRYNADTRILTAYVDLRGMQVDQELLRHFYFFDGALWVINKIANYSLTTAGTTQCEFVKVRNVKAYSEGQLLPKELYLWIGSEGESTARVELPAGGGIAIDTVYTDGTPYVISNDTGVPAAILRKPGGGYSLSAILPANTSATPKSYTIVVGIREVAEKIVKLTIQQAKA